MVGSCGIMFAASLAVTYSSVCSVPRCSATAFAYGGNKAALHHLTQAVAFEMAPHGIAVNVLSPSEPVITPGNLVAAAGETDWASPEDFAEATLRVALATPETMTGQLLWSEDVLHPERGQRGWLRSSP